MPWDVSPGDFKLGARYLFLAVRSVTPPSFESAGLAAWMVRGVLPYFISIILLSPSGSGFYSRCKVEIVVLGYDPMRSDSRAQVGTLNDLGAVRYGLPCQPQAGATNTKVGLRGPPQF